MKTEVYCKIENKDDVLIWIPHLLKALASLDFDVIVHINGDVKT
jgi:hypothetical protein